MEVCIWGGLLVVSPIGSWSSSLVIRVVLTGGSWCNLECMLSNLGDSQKGVAVNFSLSFNSLSLTARAVVKLRVSDHQPQ